MGLILVCCFYGIEEGMEEGRFPDWRYDRKEGMSVNGCDEMTEQYEIVVGMMDRAVLEVSKRVAKLQFKRLEGQEFHLKPAGSLLIQTEGDYRCALLLSVESNILKEITKNMKRQSQVTQEDIVVYVKEYYNILCGYFISHLNTRFHLKTRFGIPQFLAKNDSGEAAQEKWIRLFYENELGRMMLSCCFIV